MCLRTSCFFLYTTTSAPFALPLRPFTQRHPLKESIARIQSSPFLSPTTLWQIDGSEPRKMKAKIRLSVLGTSRMLKIAANRRSRCRFVSKEEHACTVSFTCLFSFAVSATIYKNCQVFSQTLPKEVISCSKAALPKRVLTC